MLKNVLTDIDKLKVISIETINYCNRKCSFCPLSLKPLPKKIMEEKLFYKIIGDLTEMKFNGTIIMSHYDEPLLDKRLLSFIRYARKKLKDAKICFFTNGDLLTPECAKEYLCNGTDEIIVSQHDKMPSKQIMELKRYEWMKKIHFSKVTEDSIFILNSRCGSVNIKSLNPLSCSLNGMFIRADGISTLCCNDYYNEVSFGTVNDISVGRIWNDIRYRKARKDLKRGIFNFDICKRCRGE